MIMIIAPILTQRLCIRPFVHTDYAAVATYASDPDVMHYMGSGAMSGAQIEAFVAQQMTTEVTAYALVLRDSTTLIGHMLCHPWFAPRTYELGWVIAPAYQRHGYASEAAQTLRDYCFASLDAHRVIATCQPDNPASYRVMEKIGLRREGHFRQCIQRSETEWWDEYFYALLRDEWSPA